VTGIHDVSLILRFGNLLGLHPLVVEDILNTDHRPKVDEYNDYTFFVVKVMKFAPDQQTIESGQISLIMGKNYVILFKEQEQGTFQQVQQRLARNQGKMRKRGIDYLTYELLDGIIDTYFLVSDGLSDFVETMEEEVLNEPGPEVLRAIHRARNSLLIARRNLLPLREMVAKLRRGSIGVFSPENQPFLSDAFDHVVHIIDTLETFRDILFGMLDIYLSSVSNKMNEIMKVLTIISTIFIPLTFIAGVYGMNFHHMPELDSPVAYPLVWVIMVGIAVMLGFYFKKKGWI
jgi:magnesium transporter